MKSNDDKRHYLRYSYDSEEYEKILLIRFRFLVTRLLPLFLVLAILGLLIAYLVGGFD